MISRPLAFVIVGAGGFMVQIASLALLTLAWHVPVAIATLVAVEMAILFNFAWHERWTWADRPKLTADRIQRLARFHTANGAASLVGTVAVTWALTRFIGLQPLVANTISVLLMAGFNYRAADRWVFRTAAVVLIGLLPAHASAAELKAETLAAWTKQVLRVESESLEPTPDVLKEPSGQTLDVPDGTISMWRGAVMVRNRTVAEVVDALVSSTTLPAADEVLESRVLSRQGDHLTTYMKLTRRVLISATFHTEHDVRYERRSPTLATSRSASTRIEEIGGDDRGFMWRLNSYWRYEQVGRDVRIDVRSLTLSRRVPWVLRPIAMPIVERIGRESIRSTLDAVKRFLEHAVPPAGSSDVGGQM